jgi:hypothetical protein
MVIDPFGDVVSDVMRTEGLLYCTFDPNDVLEPKQFHDLSGSCNRFDIFDLRVDRRHVKPISFNYLAGALRGQPSDGVGNHWWQRLSAVDLRACQLPDPAGGFARPAGW